ncbi:MAG: hypothetical protein ACR2FO_03310 [Actinomycetota bacterium]
MKKGKKAAPVVVFMIIGTILGAASLAWACTPAAGFVSLTQAGPVGTKFTTSTTGVGVSEIRWNSLDGPVVSTPAESFDGPVVSTPAESPGSFEVTVPQVAPGVYYLVFATEDAGVGRMAFEVTPSAGVRSPASVVPADLWSGFASGSPSVAPQAQAPVSTSNGAAAGFGLLGVGVLMMSGLALVALRRSKGRAS